MGWERWLSIMTSHVNSSQTKEPNMSIITAVDEFGQKVVAVAIDYGKIINSHELTAQDFSVSATLTDQNGNSITHPRTITRVYLNSRPSIYSYAPGGRYVIIELDPTDSCAKTTYHERESGLTKGYDLLYAVTQERPLTTQTGETIPPTTLTSTERINLVVDDFALLTYKDPSGQTMPYRLFVPKNYNPAQKYPLVMFLHGAGERGTDGTVHLQANEGAVIWAQDAEQAKRECFVLAPQCPPNRSWTHRLLTGGKEPFTPTPELKMAYAILQKVMAEYSIDKSRVYLTGLSMGGFGTWSLSMEHPETFAAIVPICGGGDPKKAHILYDKPIWTFHHAGDPVVPVEMTRAIVRELEKEDADLYYRPVLYTEYQVGDPLPYGDHASWIPAYRTEAMREWLFEQRLGARVPKVRHISPNQELPDPPFKDGRVPYGFAQTEHIKRKYLNIRYTNAPDSQKLDVYLPDDSEGPYPVMVYVHGGAFFFGSKEMDDLQPILYGLDRGYAVVSINYTLIDCTVGKDTIEESVFPQALYEAKAAIRWIRANAKIYNFDPDKIAVLGTSAGGQIAGLLGTTSYKPEMEDLSMGNKEFSSAVQAVIIAAGANHETPTWICNKFSTKIESHVHDKCPPILIIHGTNDATIPYQSAVQLANRLQAVLGEDKVKLLTVPEAGHNNDPKFFANDYVDTKKEIFDFVDGVFGI